MLRRSSSYRICLGAAVLSIALLFAIAPVARAQHKVDALSEAEVEKLRDTNREPNERVQVFIHFLDDRADRIQDLTVKPRRPGREEDIHEAMEQFLSIADDLADNLDEYGSRHWDVRKALPKLLKALDKWATTLKSPPEDESYNVSRKLALEATRDLREDATRMIEEQKTWFAAHPPAKDAQGRSRPE
jgi:hypothetical protein